MILVPFICIHNYALLLCACVLGLSNIYFGTAEKQSKCYSISLIDVNDYCVVWDGTVVKHGWIGCTY